MKSVLTYYNMVNVYCVPFPICSMGLEYLFHKNIMRMSYTDSTETLYGYDFKTEPAILITLKLLYSENTG